MVALLVVFSPATATFVAPALADDGDIEVLESSAESRFPDSINFRVKARSTSPIDDVRVHFRLASGAKGRAYRIAEFEPGEEVTAEAELLTRTGTNYIPPGTIIEYYFEIWDKEGRVHRTPKKELMYTDHRFEWRSISSGAVTVHFYGDLDERRAQSVLMAAEKATERMLPLLGIEITDPVQIVDIYPIQRHVFGDTLQVPRAQRKPDYRGNGLLKRDGIAGAQPRHVGGRHGGARVRSPAGGPSRREGPSRGAGLVERRPGRVRQHRPQRRVRQVPAEGHFNGPPQPVVVPEQVCRQAGRHPYSLRASLLGGPALWCPSTERLQSPICSKSFRKRGTSTTLCKRCTDSTSGVWTRNGVNRWDWSRWQSRNQKLRKSRKRGQRRQSPLRTLGQRQPLQSRIFHLPPNRRPSRYPHRYLLRRVKVAQPSPAVAPP